MAHEELLSLAEFIPGVRTVRFWMTFTEAYLTHVRVLEGLGLTSIEPVDYDGVPVVPLRLLKHVLPNPADLGPQTRGHTSIGCLIEGRKDNRPRRVLIYNICSHERAYAETGAQGVSYTTGVPAVLGARLVLEGAWARPGIVHPEQLPPDPFMDAIGPLGLPWQVKELDPAPADQP